MEGANVSSKTNNTNNSCYPYNEDDNDDDKELKT